MATTKLALYKIACRALGERSVASLSETTEIRRLLDEVWDAGQGAVQFFLEQGYWNHAIRSIKIDSSSSVTPAFGYSYAFARPTDFVRLVSISADEYFNYPLTRFEEETNYFYADVDPIYMRIVSNGNDYGSDMSLWPNSFTLWAGYWLATQVAPNLKNDKDVLALETRTQRLLHDARSKDASKEPPRFPPLSSWNQSRFGRSSGRDRGSRSRLIG